MKRYLSLSLAFVVVVILATGLVIRTQAASNLQVSMISSDQFSVTGNADTDDYLGLDFYCVVCRNADNSLNDIDILASTVGFAINGGAYCSDMFATDIQPYNVAVYDIGYYGANENTEAAAAYCESYAAPAAAAPVPSCIDTMAIPDWAVGGKFLSDAVLYWEPDASKATEHVIPVGSAARVLGLDETGAYAKIIWVCDTLWVDASILGPNYDAPWYGAPLPTVVVD